MASFKPINKPSALSAAFAATPVDIPKVSQSYDPSKHGRKDGLMLPTPPHSISPSLPPQAFDPNNRDRQDTPSTDDGTHLTPASKADADVGLSGGQRLSSAALETLGNNRITPAYLAQHHLPELLLEEGPLAIRHILSHLAQTLPGFSRIAPAKARRIVVAALEGKFKDEPVVEYEKVGWGRWDARRKGEPRKRRGSTALDALQEEGDEWEAQYSSRGALQIPSFSKKGPRVAGDRDYSHSYDSNMSGMDNSYDEMDAMSLDGDENDDSSDSESQSDMDISETTEEQDWAASDAAGRWEWAATPFSASPMPDRPQLSAPPLSQSASAAITGSRSRLAASKSPKLKPQSNNFTRMTLVHGRPRVQKSEITERLGMGRRSGSMPIVSGLASTGVSKAKSPSPAPVFNVNVTMQEEEAVRALLAMGTSVP